MIIVIVRYLEGGEEVSFFDNKDKADKYYFEHQDLMTDDGKVMEIEMRNNNIPVKKFNLYEDYSNSVLSVQEA